MPPAIRVENLSKRYRIGVRSRPAHDSLSDLITGTASGLWDRLHGRRPKAASHGSHGRAKAESDGTFWALRDVSFEVQPGEVVGIIGRNGAGKSTLLKILSRITEPTSGQVELCGRVASLLEVGTGFHPDLSGRENIYLNGSLLGMSRFEVKQKFDEIVAFSEIEKFLETPVKRYSSGMYVRLAFAVAAHLDPEILLVDEVLAVGDSAFQQKCIGKMKEVAKQGRTVFFVSHSLQAVGALTGRSLVMKDGRVDYDGPTEDAIENYLANTKKIGPRGEPYVNNLNATKHFVSFASVITSAGRGEHHWGKPIAFEFELSIFDPIPSLTFSFQIIDNLGRPVCHFWMLSRDLPVERKTGTFWLRCEVPSLRLYMGSYTLTTWLTERRGRSLLENLSGICEFEVSMHTHHREEYEWVHGECVYLEDATWHPVQTVSGTTK